MLYPDPELAIDKLLDASTAGTPILQVTDEDGAFHRAWKISDAPTIGRIQELMSDKKLLIADGHHRYETALAFRNENPGLADAGKVMMTFVNMHSPGLEILATHRVLKGVQTAKLRGRPLSSLEDLRQVFLSPAPDKIRIGIALRGGEIYLYKRVLAAGELEVKVWHDFLLSEYLGVG